MFKNLSQIDAEAEEEQYMDQIERMLAITPTNYRLITEKLDHLKSTGKDEECRAYAKQVMDNYAYYEGEFDAYLNDDNKPWDYSIGSDDKADYKESQRSLKEARKNIKKEFYAHYYTSLIDHYKGKEQPDKVLPLYDELIGIEKHRADYRTNKAEYLFNLERYDEALTELEAVLRINPYDAATYELIGDIHKDKQDKDKALVSYERARELGSSGGSAYDFLGYGTDNGVEEKIVEITGPRKLKNKFKTPSFQEMMAEGVDELYKSEQSVILGYTRDIVYDEFGYANLYSKLLVKIMSEAGAKEWIEHDFFYLGQIDNLKLIKKDGAEIFPDRRGTAVVFKNLQPGDIIQVEGSMDWRPTVPFGNELIIFNLMNFPQPTHYSKFEVGVPKGKYLGYRLHNLADKLEKEERDGMDFYRWEYTKLPKVIEEDAQLDRTDPFAIILVSTVPDWSPIVDWYESQSYRKLEADYEIANILDTIITEGMTEQDKVIAVYNFITKEINYSYNTMLQTGYIPKKTGLTCSSRIGDCKDVATLMITMLRELDIDAFYVLVKSNQYFHVKTLPSTFFDHVITGYKLSDGQVRYLELTTDFYPWYVLNENDIQAWALKIVDGETDIFQLPNDLIDPGKSPVRYDIRATVGQDQTLSLQVGATYSGMAGGYMREIIDMTSNDNMNNRVLEALNNKNFKNLELDTYAFENEKELTEPFRASYTLSAENYGEAVADLTLINIPYIKVIEPNTIFSNKERFSAINLSEIVSVYPTEQVVDITFPPGHRLKEVPQNIMVDNPFLTYGVTFEKTTAGIRITKKQVIKRMYVSVDEFQEFRKHYLALVGYDAMKLVLIR
jgi:tetratricopeptide (TPR) repeat protein